MPQPTREQFEAAAQKVAQTAPPGLSRDEFFALVDKELSGGAASNSPLLHMMDKSSWSADEPQTPQQKSWLGRAIDALVTNPLIQGAAHPSTKADFTSLLVPSEAAMGQGGAAFIRSTHLPQGMQRVGGGMEKLGDALKGPSLPLAVADAVKGRQPLETAAIALGPHAIKGAGTIVRKTGEGLAKWGVPAEGSFARGGTTPAPTVSPQMIEEMLQEEMGGSPHAVGGTTPAPPIDQGAMPTSSMSEVDRYMPNKSGVGEPPTGAGAGGASTPEGAVLGEPIPTPDASGPEELRRMFGSRDAASQLGMSKEELLQAAPGPSRTPIDVENKMGDASFDRVINQDPEMQDPMLRALIEQLFGGRKP